MKRTPDGFWPHFWAWLVPAVAVVAVPVDLVRIGNLAGSRPTHTGRVWEKETAEATFVGDTPAEVARKLGPDFREFFSNSTGQTTGMQYSSMKLRINGREMTGGMMIHFGKGGRCWAAELLPPPTR